jgi:hypothetical protein
MTKERIKSKQSVYLVQNCVFFFAVFYLFAICKQTLLTIWNYTLKSTIMDLLKTTSLMGEEGRNAQIFEKCY